MIENTDIGYSTALLYIDVANNLASVKDRLADSNPLELTLRQVRDAIRDARHERGEGKPGSGKRKTVAARPSPPDEGDEVDGDSNDNDAPETGDASTGTRKWEREVAKAEAEAAEIDDEGPSPAASDRRTAAKARQRSRWQPAQEGEGEYRAMRTPFPYFGSKSKIAPDIWRRFGNPAYYFESFAGALGVLLRRPTPGKYEFVGDIDCLITNFFRAAKYAAPLKLAKLTDWPISQLDLEARTKWLRQQRGLLHRLLTDNPKAYDLECAAWYGWAQSVRISANGATIVLGQAAGVRRRNEDLEKYFGDLDNRLKNVVLHYGDWTRLANAAERLSKRANCAILLDPPYDYSTNRQKKLYEHDSADVSAYVRRWALARAKTHPRLRIALCGFEGEHQMPPTWEELPWWSNYSRGKERIWFSPNCLKVTKQKSKPSLKV